MIEKTYRMLTQKQKDQIEYKAKETLRVNLSKITYKYKNLKETNNYILEKKQEREIAKAYNKAELRKKNQIRKAEGKKVKEKVKTEARYKTKADRYFSRVVRSIWAWKWDDWTRYNKDYVWNTYPILKLTCGHCISRAVLTTRYDLDNCMPQTWWDNEQEYYRPYLKTIFKESIVKQRGQRVMDRLEKAEQKWATESKSLKTMKDKVNMSEMYEKRKKEYQTYKHMRE